jgi:hypothetical protein
MRRRIALRIVAIFSLALATFSLTLGTSAPARAFGTHHAFCLTGDEWLGLSNYTFDSYAQCQAFVGPRPHLYREPIFRRPER